MSVLMFYQSGLSLPLSLSSFVSSVSGPVYVWHVITLLIRCALQSASLSVKLVLTPLSSPSPLQKVLRLFHPDLTHSKAFSLLLLVSFTPWLSGLCSFLTQDLRNYACLVSSFQHNAITHQGDCYFRSRSECICLKEEFQDTLHCPTTGILCIDCDYNFNTWRQTQKI